MVLPVAFCLKAHQFDFWQKFGKMYFVCVFSQNTISNAGSYESECELTTRDRRSERLGYQRTGAELAVRGPTERGIRLEGRSRGAGGGCQRGLRTNTRTKHVNIHSAFCSADTPERVKHTCTMAGSWGRLQVGLGGSHTVRSLMSLPLNMMYSKTSSRGGIGLSVGRSSVPKDFTRGENENVQY